MAAPSPVLFPLMCAVKTRENTRNPTASTDPAVAASATARSARSRWRCGTPLGPEVVVAVGDVVESLRRADLHACRDRRTIDIEAPYCDAPHPWHPSDRALRGHAAVTRPFARTNASPHDGCCAVVGPFRRDHPRASWAGRHATVPEPAARAKRERRPCPA